REPMGGAPRGARTRRSLTFRAGGAARRTRAGDPRFPRRGRRSARLGLVGGRNRPRGGVGGCRERRGVTVGTQRRGGDGRRLRRLDERLVGHLLVGRRRVLVLGPLLLLEDDRVGALLLVAPALEVGGEELAALVRLVQPQHETLTVLGERLVGLVAEAHRVDAHVGELVRGPVGGVVRARDRQQTHHDIRVVGEVLGVLTRRGRLTVPARRVLPCRDERRDGGRADAGHHEREEREDGGHEAPLAVL